jgi:urease accessory protein
MRKASYLVNKLDYLKFSTPINIPSEILAYKSQQQKLNVEKTGKIGVVQFSLEEDIESKKTVVKEQYAKVPLFIQRALYLEESIPSMAYIYIISPSGGILQGDRYRIDISLSNHAYAHVTTQGATRIYKMEQDFGTQMINIAVDEGCYFEYIPDQIIPFRNSRFYQIVNLKVHESATMIYSEMLVPGRVASGESFEYDICYIKTIAKDYYEKMRFIDIMKLEPKKENLESFGIMNNFEIIANVYILCKEKYVNNLKEKINMTMKNKNKIYGGTSSFPNNNGAVVRILGNTTKDVKKIIFDILSISRQTILGASFSGIRKA